MVNPYNRENLFICPPLEKEGQDVEVTYNALYNVNLQPHTSSFIVYTLVSPPLKKGGAGVVCHIIGLA